MTKKIRRTSDLIPDKRNANKGTERGAALLENSLRRLGAGRSVLVDKNGVVIAGNKTVEQAVALGLEDVVVVATDGKKLVVVQRTDLDLKKSKTAKELAVADNRVAELDLSWDAKVLVALNDEIGLAGLFSDKELVSFLADCEVPSVPAAGEDEQGRLDSEDGVVKCPRCDHEFKP